MKTQIQTMRNIPDEDVPKTVNRAKKDPRYVSHKVIPQGDGTSTIEVTLKVPDKPSE